MAYQWVATEMLTGRIIADLPNLIVPTVKQTLGKYQTATATLPFAHLPVNWVRATLQGATVLNLLDDEHGLCVWGGFVTQRPRNTGDSMDLSLATIPAYFDRRYVGDVTYTGQGQNAIVADLISRFVAAGSNGGIPIEVVQTTTGAGALRTRTYADSDDKTVYSVLTELMGVDGGPEWVDGWVWDQGAGTVKPVLYVGDRVGVPVAPGLAPAAVFDIPGNSASAELLEDFTAGAGGNDFLAVSTAVADHRPESVHVVTVDPDRPTFEVRFTPSTSIDDTDTLDAHARAKAAQQSGGTNTLSLTAPLKKAPRLGFDWSAGDDIGFVLGGIRPDPTTVTADDVYIDVYTDVYGATGRVLLHPDGIDSVPAFPAGMSGVVRATGWQIDFADQGGVPMLTPLITTPGGDQ